MMMFIGNKSGSGKVAAVTLLASALLLLLAIAGCGDDQEATNASTAEVKTVTVTATTTTAAVAKPVTTATTSTQADCPPANETPSPVAAPSIVSYTVDKGNYNVGDLIKFSAQIQGEAASVRVIYGPSGGDISSTHYISVMTVQSTSGGVTTWGTGGFAPEGSSMPGIVGQCFYRVEIVTADNTLIKALDDSHYFQVN